MQAIGTYQGWDQATYVIQVSPSDIMELKMQLTILQATVQATGEVKTKSKWETLCDRLLDQEFGLESHATEVIM